MQQEEVVAQKQREVEQLRAQVQQLKQQLQEKERENYGAIQTSEELVAQLQETLVEKDRTSSDLQQTISAQKQSASVEQMGKTSTVTQGVSRLKWKDGKKAPVSMNRGSTVVDGNMVYIKPAGNSLKIYSCQISSQDLHWSTLPDTEYYNSSLAVIDGILTTIGGDQYPKYTNSLLSLTGRVEGRQWSKIFRAMPTPRNETVSVTTQQTLIVAGGYDGKENLNVVEVMNIPTKQWTTASHLPHPFGWISGTICGNQLYLAGGYVGYGEPSKSVLTCSVTDLLSPPSLATALPTLALADKTGVWHRFQDLPVTKSTLITLGGHLLAIGGWDDSGRDTADVHCYDTHTDSWQVVSNMKNRSRLCLAAILPEDSLLVVGGDCGFAAIDSVQIGSLQ